MKTAIFLSCIIGLTIAIPANHDHQRVKRSRSFSSSDSNSLELNQVPTSALLQLIQNIIKTLAATTPTTTTPTTTTPTTTTLPTTKKP
ncbi:myb-like protein X [Lepisosteus oculatus]|uniref:myb-like protein X n=1 Tax=Lepisosteus oculatus TaxID=7918 RepID=UPI0035F50930